MAKYAWLFVDGKTQETFRIRSGDPIWESGDDGIFSVAQCAFNIVGEDGTDFLFQLKITGGVLDSQGVGSPEELISFINSKGTDIIEGVINRGVRGDQEILWESDGVSVE